MRKISDLVITLENEKGEDIEIRTKKINEARKNLGHWKEPEKNKRTSSISSIKNNSNRNIRGDIYSRGESTRNSIIIPRSVLTEGRISIGAVVPNRHTSEKDRIGVIADGFDKMWLQQNNSTFF